MTHLCAFLKANSNWKKKIKLKTLQSTTVPKYSTNFHISKKNVKGSDFSFLVRTDYQHLLRFGLDCVINIRGRIHVTSEISSKNDKNEMIWRALLEARRGHRVNPRPFAYRVWNYSSIKLVRVFEKGTMKNDTIITSNKQNVTRTVFFI